MLRSTNMFWLRRTVLVVPDADELAYTARTTLEEGEETGDSTLIALARLVRGFTLLHHSPDHHDAGIGLLTEAYDHLARLSGGLRRFADIEIARHRVFIGDLDGAILLAQATLDEQFATGEMISRGSATTVLVEALLLRGASGDVDRARADF